MTYPIHPSPVYRCDSKVVQICHQLKPACERYENKIHPVFEPCFYRTVVVPTGITYYVKVRVGSNYNSYCHYKIFCGHTNVPQLISCETNQTISSEIICN